MQLHPGFFPAIIVIGIVWIMFGLRKKPHESDESGVGHPMMARLDPVVLVRAKRARLSENQIFALSCAGFDRPIYGEKQAFRHAQMPDGSRAFHLRTIDSLLKRGYLVSDKQGGYVLTQEGYMALRSAMGF